MIASFHKEGSLTPPLFIEVPVQSQEMSVVVVVCYGNRFVSVFTICQLDCFNSEVFFSFYYTINIWCVFI